MLAPISADEERAYRLTWGALSAGLRVVVRDAQTPTPWPVKENPRVVERARQLARGQQVEPVLLAGLAALGVDAHAPRPHAQLATLNAVRATRALVHRGLARAGVGHVFLKGAAVEDTLWGGEGWRGCVDVDVLVDAHQERVARGVLVAAGWRMEVPASHRVTTLASKERTFVPVLPGVDRVPVDLHVRPFNPPYTADVPALVSRAQRAAVTGGAVPIPSAQDQLWLAAGNLAGDRFLPRFKLALDTWLLLRACPPAVEGAVERARESGCGWALWALLQLVTARLGAELPPVSLATITPPGWMQPVLLELAGVTGVPPRITRRWARVLAQDWPWSGQAGFVPRAAARWAVLRMADRVAG